MKTVMHSLKTSLDVVLKSGLAIAFLFASSPQLPAHAAYSDIISTFDGLNDTTTYPVSGKSFDDIRSTFGPRILSSTSAYDFHRGIDIQAANGTDVVAPIAGKFEKYRYYNSCGHTVILRHDLADPITYNGKTVNRYYTWYCHLKDGNTVSGWKKGKSVAQGTVLGKVGKSGSATYDHLHFELRIGTNNSLEYQEDNYDPGDSGYFGFDPHMHPMLLFEPYEYDSSASNTYSQDLTVLTADPTAGSDVKVEYESSNDDMPLLNRIEVAISNSGGVEHVLDLNRRIGYDATSTKKLDKPDKTVPYLDPEPWIPSSTTYTTNLVIPGTWTSSYSGHTITVTVHDLWGNSESKIISLD